MTVAIGREGDRHVAPELVRAEALRPEMDAVRRVGGEDHVRETLSRERAAAEIDGAPKPARRVDGIALHGDGDTSVEVALLQVGLVLGETSPEERITVG